MATNSSNIRNQLKSPEVLAAFDRAMDTETAKKIDEGNEVNRLGVAAAKAKSSTSAQHDLDLLGGKGARKLFVGEAQAQAIKLAGDFKTKPHITAATDSDPRLTMDQTKFNEVRLAGRAKGDNCPDGAMCIIFLPSQVSIELNGEKFTVQPNAPRFDRFHGGELGPGETAKSILQRLAKKMEAAGYKISIAGPEDRAVLRVLEKKNPGTVSISGATSTDAHVSLSNEGDTIRFSTKPMGSTVAGNGTLSVEINGKTISVPTKLDENNAGQGEPGANAAMRLAVAIENETHMNVVITDKIGRDTTELSMKVIPAGAKTRYEPKTWDDLYGKVEHVAGDGDRAGAYLRLDKPIRVGSIETDLIKLHSYREEELFKAGASVHVSGRLDVLGEQSNPAVPYVAMTGLSSLTAHEPRYDGGYFYDSKGEQLTQLWHNVRIPDYPSSTFVLDHETGKAFAGHIGGFLPPWANWFSGFSSVHEIERVTSAPVNISVEAGELVVKNHDGKKLVQIGRENPDPLSADIPGRTWFLDTKAGTAYGVSDGGRAVRHNVDSVIRGLKTPFGDLPDVDIL